MFVSDTEINRESSIDVEIYSKKAMSYRILFIFIKFRSGRIT